MADLTVAGVGRIVVVGHKPLVDTEHTTGLEDLEDLGVDTLQTGRVDGRLDRVHSIERVRLKRHLHEISFDELVLIGETGLLSVVGRTLDLVVVVVETDNIYVREARHLAGGATDAAADIEDLHARLQTHHMCQVVLVARDRLAEALAPVEAAEVE